MENKMTDIVIITNSNKRLNTLIPIFERLDGAKAGKFVKDRYFCIESKLKLNSINSKEDATFNMLQEHNYRLGIKTICYSLNIDI